MGPLTRVLCACAIGFAVACEEGSPSAAPAQMDGGDAQASPLPDVYLPELPDAGPDDFEPADPPDANPAVNPYMPPEPQPDAGVIVRPPPVRSCIELEPGDEVQLEGVLDDTSTWARIDPTACPATLVTNVEVAFVAYELCASTVPRTVELVMRGADMSEDPETAVADPLLVVYSTQQQLSADPFACVAVNDDGLFDGFAYNSARIEALEIPADTPRVVVATSRERPAERGVGAFVLTLRAD